MQADVPGTAPESFVNTEAAVLSPASAQPVGADHLVVLWREVTTVAGRQDEAMATGRGQDDGVGNFQDPLLAAERL